MNKTNRKNRKRSSWKTVSKRRSFKPQTITTDLGGMPMFLTVTDGTSRNAATTYINAHSLLPRTELEAAIKPQPTPREAIATLRDEGAEPGKLLHAIVVLGHVPSSEAYEALMAHAKSGRVHADVAKCAADECAGWMAGCPDELAGMDALRAAAAN